MSESEREATASRRDFLKVATVGASAAGAAALAGAGEASAGEAPTELGYHKSEHVRAYLESCRF
jgi:hypothetical protein